jgi:uncharacterized membrane protein YfcA
MTIILLCLIGVVSATMGSLVGLGGGVVIVPALIYLDEMIMNMGISTSVAVGTSLFVLIFTALSSTLSFMKQKKIDYKSGWLFFAASGPAAMVGAGLTRFFEPQDFKLWFGLFILFIFILMLIKNRLKPLQVNWAIQKTYTDAQGNSLTYGYNLFAVLTVGGVAGLISGLFGVGGGSVMVPAMMLLFSFPIHVATATSMFVIFFSAITGSITHIALDEINWFAAIFLIPGAWIGGLIGAKIAHRISSNALLWIFRAVLLIIALRMISDGLLA